MQKRKEIKYFIEMPGLSSEDIGNVIIDNKYAIFLVHPTNLLAIRPLFGKNNPSFEDVVFYTNCLVYEHDLPAFIIPVKRKAIITPIKEAREKYTRDLYFQMMSMAYEAVINIRLGSLAYVDFRWPGWEKSVNLSYSQKYLKVSKEMSLYGTAIRQIDPLFEFLGYFRVLESAVGPNVKEWIKRNRSRINTYNFGFLGIGTDAKLTLKPKRINLFSIYRRRALKRINELDIRLKDISLERYLYNENRCGIAHGKTDVKIQDFGFTIEEISKDNYILKLLARIAIEDKIKQD